ncbi:hypothetical protein [Micromonospora sp. NBC_00858]|uniref:hypothetical protein n=1 Tax=Micromonospora sp. NBC_00858 TaxID=2975979 RepID=UPI003868FDDE|nr:hypothetical protein OG990_30310 [Micromonospora sp. NBC_00858]
MAESISNEEKSSLLAKYSIEEGNPPGWAESVIDKIQKEIQDDRRLLESDFQSNAAFQVGLSNFNAEEKAAWDYYQNSIQDPDGLWETRQLNEIEDTLDKEGKFNEGHWYYGKAIKTDYDPHEDSLGNWYIDRESDPDLPVLPKYEGSDNKNHDLVVSTEALKYLKRQIGKLVDEKDSAIALDAKAKVAAVDIRPGGFAKAELLRQKIVGGAAGGGLQSETMELLQAVHDTLLQIKQNIDTLIIEYDSAEDFNKMTTQQLSEVMEGAWSKIDSMKDHGQSKGEITGG